MKKVFRAWAKVFFSARVLVAAVCIFAFVGASSCEQQAKPVVITLLHTNDVHSHLMPEVAESEVNPYGLGGLARMATLVQTVRMKNPNALLLDAGDWSEGSSFFFNDGGANMLKIYSAMGYDAAVVGNHDFLNGPFEAANAVARAKPSFPVLGANKDLSDTKLAGSRDFIKQWVKDYTILDAGNGVRVAVIGLLCVDFFYYRYFNPGVITDAVNRASQITQYLRSNNLADVIVLLSHNSFDLNVSFAKQVPWVNVVISGHSHYKTPTVTQTSNAGQPAYIVETGQWGQFLGEMNLFVSKEYKQVLLKDYKLNPVKATLPEDPVVAGMIEAEKTALSARLGANAFADTGIKALGEFRKSDTRETSMSNFAADAYRKSARADIGLESTQLIHTGLPEGNLNLYQLLNVAPHVFGPVSGQSFPEHGNTWTLKNLNLSGQALKLLLNFILKAGSTVGVGAVSVSGAQIDYAIADAALNGVNMPVREIRVLNSVSQKFEAIDEQRIYKVAVHNGLMMALGIIRDYVGIPLDLNDYQETGVPVWRSIYDLAVDLKQLDPQQFQPGSRYFPIEADAGLYEHQVRFGMNASGQPQFSLRIFNEGSKPTSADLKIKVSRGGANDMVADRDGFESTVLAEGVAVPVIAAGQSVDVNVPWIGAPQARNAMYSFRFEVYGGDGKLDNNTVRRHFRW